jgi:uncharacterized membrane protein YfcA
MLNIVIGFLSGIISGMGIGGGAILIPALIMFEKINQQTAQGINLAYFIPTALVALIVHLKNKSIKVKTALILGVSGLPGAIIGSVFAGTLSDSSLRRMFGFFLLFIGIYEILKGFNEKKC